MRFLLIFLSFISFVSFANDNSEILYHCPSIKDLRLEDHNWIAKTTYNGLEINWFSVKYISDSNSSLMPYFIRVDDSDGVNCVYEASNSNDNIYIFLNISYDQYKIAKEISGPWNQGHCSSVNPEDCTLR